MKVITISRQEGSLGDEATAILAEKLGWEIIIRSRFVKEHLAGSANTYHLKMLEESPKFYLSTNSEGIIYKDLLESKLIETVEKSPVIILGMGAQLIFAGKPEVLSVKIIASPNVRAARVAKKYKVSAADAKSLINISDSKHKKYISALYSKDWSDPLLYNMTINTDYFTANDCAEIILKAAFVEGVKENLLAEGGGDIVDPYASAKSQKTANFKHPAEVEFANILDMYNLEWEYEPRTFPLEWDAEGNVKMAFSPDFYLVKFDTYIEITTMEQKYVTAKNKKIKLLKELYKGINIRIVYKKDFHSLMKRFGMESGDDD